MQNIPFSSACERNRYPILEQLKRYFPEQGNVLEIGSGTGQHAVFFTCNLSGLRWQPSDRRENIAGLEACFAAENNDRILPVLELDVLHDHWPEYEYDAAFSANTAHIMGWEAVVAMFTGLKDRLLSGSRFCLYGPFNINQQFTSESNRQFDAQLRYRDPEMGIRDIAAIELLANKSHMQLEQKLTMPANNFLLVFKRS